MTSEHDEPVGRLRGVIALLLGLASMVAALLRYDEYVYTFKVSLAPLLLVPTAALIGLCIAWRRGGLSLHLIGLSFCAAAIALAGMPELPPWVSVDSFGFSPHFQWVVLTALAGSIAYAGAGGRARLMDGALVLFVCFSAFSGPLFVRDPDVYFPLLVALGLCSALALYNQEGRSPWRVPFVMGFLALALLTLAAVVTAEDRHRHLTGWTRLAIAGVPLLALGMGRLEVGRVRRMIGAYAAMVLAGVLCTTITLGEAGHYFTLHHALAARLRLFGQDPNIIAPYFAVAPPLLLAMLITARRWWSVLLLLITLPAAVYALKLTGSTTSIAAAGAGLATFGLLAIGVELWRRNVRKALAGVGLILLLGALIGGYLKQDEILSKKDKILNHSSLVFRMYLWQTAVAAIEDRPLLGYGFLCREPLMTHAVSSDLDGRTKDIHPHQIILDMALGAGVPAAMLFVALVLFFCVRMLVASVRLERREESLLSLAVLGSAVALALANMLDQGLSLNTPFALHLGMLLGTGSLLVMCSRRQQPVAAGAGSRLGGRVLLGVLWAAVFGLNTLVLASDRLSHRVGYEIARNDLQRADGFSSLNYAMNPWCLGALLERADVLDRRGETQAAVDVLWEGTRRHPLAWQPWDKLSVLELKGSKLQGSLNAVQEAIARDPTGPRTSTWALRGATTLMRMKRHDEAVEEMARAFRFDFTAPDQLTWDKRKEGYVYDPGDGLRPIFLEAVLMRNKRMIQPLCRQDPVAGRRIATTLAKIGQKFYLFDIAEQAIDDWHKYGPYKWMSLEIVAEEIRQARHALAKLGAGHNAGATRREFQESEFEGQAGEAGIGLSRGSNFLENGEPQRAMIAFKEGIDVVDDMYSERDTVAQLVDGALQASLKSGDFASADHWLRPAIYFHRLAVDRVERFLWVAQTHSTAGEHKKVIEAMSRAVPYVRKLQPGRAVDQLNQAAMILAPYSAASAPSHLRDGVQAVIDSFHGAPQGRLLEAYVLRERGDKEGARELLRKLAQDEPMWNFDRVKAPEWKEPQKGK